ncbi:MAG: 4-(cytidine 5'-diphospho)-2-C-methyl-D-erythritol kinase [Acidobacteriota bacterium]|nr:4-(cytidine 5'-diphospho)-2-C-methyl-D-erythritol kinase [Acidobacteriota bacterium]MDQ7088283.1 4-(cytidine 5'-diphospho)-2-C-methyl-D-erythritol kinase [Acidobacteriota bacterium]
MRRRIEVRAFAKINWVLDLLGPRDDGYTEIATVFQTIDLADRVILGLRDAEEPSVALRLAGRPLDVAPERNLALRAARAWLAETGRSEAVEIVLDKRIPAQAGLGGGSADAAAVLDGLDRLAGRPLGAARLSRLGAALGADVPFLIEGGTALGEGRGDRLRPLDEPATLFLVLVAGGAGLATATVFERARRGLTAAGKAPNIQRFLRYLQEGAQGPPPVGNQLLPAAMALDPEIGGLVRRLEEEGARATMTGSGSVVYGVFPTEASAREAAGHLVEEGGQASWIEISRTLRRAEVERLRVTDSPVGEE